MSSLQPSHQDNNTTAALWNTADTETAQLYAELFQAQADYAAMQQQFSAFAAENTPSSIVEAVNHSSVNNVASPLTSNNNTACGPCFFSGSQQQQVEQLDQVQTQIMQGGPQVDYHLREDDPSQQLHCGLITSGIVKCINIADPNIIQNHPTRLSIPSDEQFLDPVYNFLRSACIEVFVATDETTREDVDVEPKPLDRWDYVVCIVNIFRGIGGPIRRYLILLERAISLSP